MESSTDTSLVKRVGKIASNLVSLHLQAAQQEAARDRARVIGGLVFIAIGAVLALTALALFQFAAVAWLNELFIRRGYRHTLALAVSAVAGFDLLVGILFLVVGSRKMRGPFVPETRALVRRTIATLTEADT